MAGPTQGSKHLFSLEKLDYTDDSIDHSINFHFLFSTRLLIFNVF